MDGEALNSFFTTLGLRLPFNRKEIESYINLQRNLKVKDKQKKERINHRIDTKQKTLGLKKGKVVHTYNSEYSESNSPVTNRSPEESVLKDSKSGNKLWEKRV